MIQQKNRSPIRNHPGQLEIWKTKERFIVACCGRRFGKTYLAIELLLYNSDIPGSRCVYVAPTFGQARDIAWDQLKKRIIELGWKHTPNETHLTI